MLNSGVKSLEHVLYTHTHADHCHGFDDLRVFYFKHKKHVNCWLSEEHLLEFQKRFSYAFQERHFMDNKPQVQTRSFHSGKPFEVEGLMVHPVLVPHGLEKTTAFRIGSFVYATDFKTIPEDTISSWQGKIHTMIASGVGFKEQYATHSSVAETVRLFQRLGVQRGIITHLSHEVDYGRDAALLPPHVCFAHDGMSLELEIDNV